MKRKIAFLAAICVTAALQARILRVNNVSGMAPYASIQDAVDAAQDGDTIMVDGSPQAYERTTLNKRVVLVGPGYFLQENGIATATVTGITEAVAELCLPDWAEPHTLYHIDSREE